jgi:hypothetical protein
MAQPDFIDSYIAHGTRRSSETINEENAYSRQSKKCFSRPLLNQLGRNHGQGREWPSVTVHMQSAKRDQCLASPTLCDYRCASRFIPTLYHSHYCERLSWEGLAEELPDERRTWLIDPVKRWVHVKNPFSQF